jgi:hypothetical protein
MINPFKATKQAVSSMFRDAKGSDVAPGMSIAGTVILMPLVVPGAFVCALFTSKSKDK